MQSSTASAKNNANQHPWQTDDDHYAFMEGLMGEDYAKELPTSNKNTAQNKQEKYSNMANNKNNSAGSTNNAADTATKKTVRGEGLHYLPNGGTDSKGNSLPAGSYIRVQNGVEYVVLPGDPRIPERIEAEYQKQKNTQPQAAATPIQSDTVQKTETQVDSQQVPSPEAETEEDFWENVFEQPQEEKAYIELPNNIFGEDEIDTSDYDSFVDYIEENGLYYDFYAGYNEQGEKVRFAELYDRETGERLATLQEGKDFFYAKDGVFFTKDFTYHSRGRKILEMRAGIHVGDDARELFEGLGYEISISGDTIYITDETGKTLTFARGEEFSATKNGIFIAPGALNSKTIQDLIKNSPKSRGYAPANSSNALEAMRSYAGDAANDENTVTHAVVSAMEALDSDKALRQEIETSKQQGLGAQIWAALDNAWDSLVKGVNGIGPAFENAGESFMKGVSGIDEAFVSGGEALAKSWNDLGEVLTSEETKKALYLTVYSALGVLSGGLTTILGSGNDDLDDAFMWINLTRMMSPTSWLPVPATVVDQIGSIVSKGGTIKDAIDYLMQQLFEKE